ncbi:MAG TPA: CPBP family intramembrane glutamic endopeptidase [Pyrinomonadaceae bacterium]|nr:CPBP family intramembrane glutamic endopeptidase [Pyrinomonadaceae bacterium]
MRALRPENKSPWTFFSLVFILSVPFWLLGPAAGRLLRNVIPINLPAGALQAVNPTLAALILARTENGSGGVRGLLKRAADYRKIKRKIWYVPVFCLWPAAMFLEYGLMSLAGAALPDSQFPVLMVPAFLLLFFVAGACEELGWQGCAFDRLRGQRSALEVGLILGAAWAACHVVPLAQASRAPSWIVWQCLGMFPFRILIVRVYNNTGRSVFAASAFHATSNVAQFSFPNYGSHYDPFIAWLILTCAAAAVALLWGPQTLARYRYARAA